MAIPHVDVKAQYAPLIPELQDAFARTLETGRFIFGPEVEAFEREAAELLGVDEVICPTFTFYATAEAIARRGATPVFAEIDSVSLNLDPADVERRITDRTKAIMPVHLFGRPAADFSGLGLPVIEDAAQAFGAGGIATSVASTFSFFPTKNLFALGDGGLIAVNDPEVAQRIRMLRFHGSAAKKEFMYVGYNSRLDAVQASFLRIFLRHLGAWNELRREAAERYRELLDGVVDVPQDEPGHVYHMFCVRSPERDKLAAALEQADIGFAVYYQPPLHLQPALRYLGYSEGDFPETERASRENLCLPLWAGITEEQQEEVVSVLKRASELVHS
jgi:dTDP-4-amino-4,6-dideoxygalactose transaminase